MSGVHDNLALALPMTEQRLGTRTSYQSYPSGCRLSAGARLQEKPSRLRIPRGATLIASFEWPKTCRHPWVVAHNGSIPLSKLLA